MILISVPHFQVETTKVFLLDTSVVSPYSLLLFGGSMVIQHQVFCLSSNTRLLDYWTLGLLSYLPHYGIHFELTVLEYVV
jgi:hypothetical protein